ncbi:metal-dependent hydrolase [uncultured Microscilla sp.]|uniref:metal-dependent hydrolase n=1 Tax=uncultured Microscilla sp. TaxID=432653 RepID=UPI0026017928|nr:metal-dependent hydrolase [uncultured Microscilla sp.]
MKFTFYGHACFSVEMNGKTVLFDPFITDNELAKNIKVADIKADYILLTHGHGDHVADAAQIAKQSDATIVSNYEIVTWFQNQGIEKGHPMNHGGNWQFDFGKVKYVNAVHSSMLPDGSYGGNAGGFVVYGNEQTFYNAGDTALTLDMQLIPKFAQLDFAILPIGDNFTMGIDDAVIAADFIECNKIVGIHYDTFGYIKIDHKAAKETFKKAGKELILLDIGETIDL